MTRGRYKLSPAPATPRSLGQRIRAVRKGWDLRQEELAARLGVDQTAVSKWERDLVVPSDTVLMLMENVFGLSREALLTGKGFSIPELPSYLNPLRPSLAAEHLPLPPPPAKGKARWVDESTGAQRELSRAQLQASLDRALQQGRPVWVLVGEPG